MFKLKNIDYPSNNIFIRIFKWEAQVELWTFDNESNKYILIKTYNICALSGELGPKRKRGDLQIPEGFYHISLFNPVSNFYLSLKLNYPNASDKILGYKKDLGGDIFIHGDCVTIGCIPITDSMIKELYWLAVQAKENGQLKIPVHIFPAKLTQKNIQMLMNTFVGKKSMIEFWRNLQEGFTAFNETKLLPKIDIDESGKYLFRNGGL